MRKLFFLFFASVAFLQCTKPVQPPPPAPDVTAPYFPPIGSSTWETITPASLNWNEAELSSLYAYLQQKNTKAFLILKNGRLVTEKYFDNFTADSNWYWASAGKTATALLVGIAQQEGLLNTNNRTAQYLGAGWTSLPAVKENLITIKHQLTMTSGLDDGGDDDCTLPACLQYRADAGSRWAYHNAPYTLLDKVVEAATGNSFNGFFQQKIRDRIGMNGLWLHNGYNNVYYSTPRSAARFGLLLLNRGKWNGTPVLSDTAYYNSMVNTSQSINASYGYLTWLNGKNSYMMPTLQAQFNGSMVPNAPADMYAALGKNDQKIYVVPSQGLVVVRLGNAAGGAALAASGFDNELWGKLKAVLRW